jgi:hypothetical protein
VVGLVTGITALAVDGPVGLAGNCVAGYCLVPVPGAETATAATRGLLDGYWNDAPDTASFGSIVGGSRETLLARASRAFSWGDFGIGIGVAVGALLMLVAVACAVGFRVSRDSAADQAGAA